MVEKQKAKKRRLIVFGVVAFIGATFITISTFRDQNGYPAWVFRSFLALSTTGYLWSTLMIIMSLEIFFLTKTQFALLNWLRIALAGVMLGMVIILGFAGYMK
jgi:uncharacterized membrane protein